MMFAELLERVVDDGMPHAQAVRHVLQTVEREPELVRAWWEEYGEASVSGAIAHLRSGKNGNGSGGHVQLRGPRTAPSWRDRLRSDPTQALEVELPVDGRCVKIRDLTPANIEWIENSYRGIAQIAQARAEKWGRIRRKMAWDDTVRSAVDSGRIKLSDIVATGFHERLEIGEVQP